jgi:hypothetical protein
MPSPPGDLTPPPVDVVHAGARASGQFRRPSAINFRIISVDQRVTYSGCVGSNLSSQWCRPAAGRSYPMSDVRQQLTRAEWVDATILSVIIAEALHDLEPSRWLVLDPILSELTSLQTRCQPSTCTKMTTRCAASPPSTLDPCRLPPGCPAAARATTSGGSAAAACSRPTTRAGFSPTKSRRSSQRCARPTPAVRPRPGRAAPPPVRPRRVGSPATTPDSHANHSRGGQA